MRPSLNHFALPLAMLTALGCGTRSPLTLGGRPRTDAGAQDAAIDAGPDAGQFFDGGPDGGIDGGPLDLELDCGRADRFTAPRLPITVEGSVVGGAPPFSAQWTLVSAAGDGHRFMDDGLSFSLIPDVPGDYVVRFDVRDSVGTMGTCSVTVHSVVGPPVAICPEPPVRTAINEPLELVGEGFDDNGIVRWGWELVDGPADADLSPRDQPVAVFVAPTLGFYRARLTVGDQDGATDSCEVEIQVTGPPTVICPPDVSGPTRQPISLMATATDDVGIVSRSWRVSSGPLASSAVPVPNDADATVFTPDVVGDYELLFSATDEEGFTESCTVRVTGLPSPPEVSCPAQIDTEPLTAVQVMATAIDDGTVVSWSWELTNGPPGTTSQPAPRTQATTRLTPDIAGIYELTVTATDNDGLTDQCTTIVNAGNVDGLRVEMFWDVDRGDMDLHLLNNEATGWGNQGGGDDVCFYGNCNTRGAPDPVLDWYGPSDDDDPRLDIDNTSGLGPENINVFRPRAGTYRVGVHGFSGGGDHRVTIRIYCGGSTTEPRETFGPVNVQSGDLWRVVDVTLGDANDCTMTDLVLPNGQPNVRDMGATGGRR